MLSRFVGAALVLCIGGVVLAGEYTGMITKADKDSITFMKREKGTKGKGTEMTVKHGKGVKITKGDDTVEGKDFHKMVSDAAEGTGKMKGVRAKITTEGEGDKEMVTAIEVMTGKGRGKKKPADDK